MTIGIVSNIGIFSEQLFDLLDTDNTFEELMIAENFSLFQDLYTMPDLLMFWPSVMQYLIAGFLFTT